MAEPEVTPPTDPAAEPPTPDPSATPEPDHADDLGDKGKAAIAAERKARADAEKALKAERAENEKLRKAQMSETEKAIADAEARGRQAATSEVGTKLAAAEIKAALTTVVPDPMAVIEDLNLAKFVGDDGEVNAEAVAALKEKYLAFSAVDPGKAPAPGVPKGARDVAPPPDLDTQIAEAMKTGQTRLAITLQNQKLLTTQ